MKKHLLKSLIILLTVVLCSCNEDEQTANRADIRFKAVSSNFSLKSALQTGSILSIQKAMIGISEVELEMEYEVEYESESGENEQEYEYEYEYEIELSGPYTVDLLSSTSTPEIVISNIEPGMYTEFEYEIDDIMSNGKSVYIEGEVEFNTTIYTFVFESEESFEIEIEGYELFNQPVSLNDLWLIGFDLDYFFFNISMENAEIVDDKIIISNTSNTGLYNQIIDRMENSFDFEDDDDEDDD